MQESAGHLLHDELGWDVAFAYNTEKLGTDGTFGRKSYKEILLTRYFREALLPLDPWLTSAQMDEAQHTLEHRLSTSFLLQINEEKYFLMRDGIPVTIKKLGGRTGIKKVCAEVGGEGPHLHRTDDSTEQRWQIPERKSVLHHLAYPKCTRSVL